MPASERARLRLVRRRRPLAVAAAEHGGVVCARHHRERRRSRSPRPHGRGFWILDDVTPLRQIDTATASADAVLFKPQAAYRVRWNTNTDTPLPPDEPGAPNPPEGAIINYYLKADASGPITLDILDTEGRIVRHYSSADPVVRPDPIGGNLPLYWFRPPMVLSTTAGMHRFTWDVHYQPLAGRWRRPRRASDCGGAVQHGARRRPPRGFRPAPIP